MSKRIEHTRTGNCTEPTFALIYRCRQCGRGNFCDVCHKHDAPRGECKKCPPCPACGRPSPGRGKS